MAIITVFDPPLPSDSPSVFDTKAFTFLGDLNTWSNEANAVQADVNAKQSTASSAATTATTQANNAATSASTASTQAGIAIAKAVEAASSATSASASASDAAAAYDQFDDRYLGSKSSDPTVDNDGNVLLTGALYWNSVSSSMRIWSGSGWVQAIGDAAATGYTPSGTGSVSTTVQAKLREMVSVKDFGAVGDGVTDDTAKIQSAINEVYSRGGGVVDCTGGRWLIDSADLIVKQGVTLQGPWNNLGETDGTNWQTIKSAFILNPSYTIRLAQEFSAIKGVAIFRKGLTDPTSLAEATTEVANFAGKAITVGYGVSKDASDTYAGYCFILGFQYAYYNDFNERPRVEYLSGDCTNGVYLNRIYDMNHLVGCHFWPYITTHNGWTFTGDAGWRRQGVAFYFGLGVDWGQALNCFSYGYDTGFEVNGSDNMVLLNCGADGYKNNNAYSVGYYAHGTTKNLNLVGCKAAAKNTSVLIDISGGGSAQSVKVTGGNLWACSSGTGTHVYVKNGDAIITGGVSMFDGPVGIKSDATAGTVTVTGCIFQTISTPFSFGNESRVIVNNNSFNGTTDASLGDRFFKDNQSGNYWFTVFTSNGAGPQLVTRTARGNSGTPAVVVGNDQGMRFRAQAWDGSAWGTFAMTRATLSGTPGVGSLPGKLIFSTTSTGATGETDRLALNESGSLYPLTDNAYQLGSTTNRWASVWSANGTIQTSDERTKTEITPSSLGLEFINKLRPVSYKWKVGSNEVVRQVYRDADGNECSSDAEGATPAEIITKEIPGNRVHWGLIAQEVKAVVDEAGVDFGGWVLSDQDDQESQQALRYDQFISPLIKAVQELTERVKALEEK